MILALVLQASLGGMPQDWNQCQRQPDLAWCVQECALDDWADWCSPLLSLDVALEIDGKARAALRLRADRKDVWRSYADKVLKGDRFAGDCDDLVSTVLDLWTRAGAPAHQIGRIVLDNPFPEEGGDPQHMVATIEIDGVVYIAADTYGPMQTLEASGYEAIWTNRASDGLKWAAVNVSLN